MTTIGGNYYVFKRSCRNWEEFASARKITVQKGLSYNEARDLCQEWNRTRTAAQIKRGTKYEFTQEGN